MGGIISNKENDRGSRRCLNTMLIRDAKPSKLYFYLSLSMVNVTSVFTSDHSTLLPDIRLYNNFIARHDIACTTD